MKKDTRHVGFDVDSEKIAVAVAEPGGEVRSLGVIPNRGESVRRLVKKLGPASRLRVCYEAGPHGYGLYWLLSGLGVHCDVIAPTLVPVRSGDRVKTNRRDALKLARCYRSGDLTAVWVPDAEHEALRDLVRAREVAKKDQLRARHRLGKFLLRRGLRAVAGMKSWTKKHLLWVKTLRFEHPAQEATYLDYLHEVEHAAERVARLERSIDQAIEALPAEMRALIAGLQALRGIKQVSAATIVAEVGPLSRFPRPKRALQCRRRRREIRGLAANSEGRHVSEARIEGGAVHADAGSCRHGDGGLSPIARAGGHHALADEPAPIASGHDAGIALTQSGEICGQGGVQHRSLAGNERDENGVGGRCRRRIPMPRARRSGGRDESVLRP